MASAEELLKADDRYDHDGPHRTFGVCRGATVGYWYGQADWQQEPRGDGSGVPAREVYTLDEVKDCCSAYGFRKGYRFRSNDYSDRRSEEEIRRSKAPSDVHLHDPLSLARGVAIGFAYARAGNLRPDTAPADLIQSCCARYGFGQGFSAGNLIFFEQATEGEKARYFDGDRAQRNDYGWG
ncbi:hypothetical protein [Streptomyces longwoodensis]|uniref:hypothetical protein n=1 Tax=Streptomyces longwoodensis TaxID=68231 RepID=UPI0034074C04